MPCLNEKFIFSPPVLMQTCAKREKNEETFSEIFLKSGNVLFMNFMISTVFNLSYLKRYHLSQMLSWCFFNLFRLKWITLASLTHMATLDTSLDYDGENGWKKVINISFLSKFVYPQPRQPLKHSQFSFMIHKARTGSNGKEIRLYAT